MGTRSQTIMASAKQQLTRVSCPGCGAQYEFPASMVGRRGSCASCGTLFTVPPARSVAHEKTTNVTPSRGTIFDDEERESSPQYIAVECHVCQTRMYGQPDQIGKELKCPDCGARTKVLPPPKKKAKNVPAALEGEQYELYDADVQPLPSDLIATQPKYIAIKCRQCDTMMYAAENDVGQTIVCPDCGRRHTVQAPPRPKQKRSVLAAAGDTPKLDPAFAPVERPPALAPEMTQKIEQELDATPYGQALAEARRTGKPLTVDSRGRPILPRWPLVTGVWRMLVTEEVITRWILLSIVLGFAGQFLGEALLTPIQGMAEAVKLIFAVIGGFLAAAWLAMAGPFMVAIVGESSDGKDTLNQPPRLLAFDWFGEMFSVVMAGSLAGLCGLGAWELARMVSWTPFMSASFVTFVVVVVLPVALLSTLLEGTPFGVLSPRLLRSFAPCAGAWLQFYVQTIALAALVVGAGWIVWNKVNPQGGNTTAVVWLVGPIAVAALLVDMRLLGRLAWCISERIPENVIDA
jgi:DNA-directed RNA polymerase subunit M/transcription elongation factor TFIIS